MTEHIGNIELLKLIKIGFLAPSHVAPLSVLPTLDWAAQMATRDDVAIMSGYSSQTEKDVLSFLLKGKCGIILVLARCHYKELPEKWKELLDNDRLLIISTSSACRQTKQTAFTRNKYICEHSTETYIPVKPSESSSLHLLSEEFDLKEIHNDVK